MDVDKFYKLKKDRAVLNSKIRLGEKEFCQNFRKEHKHWILSLDALMILCILFNIGALMITNMLVVQAQPDTEFVEINPVASELHNLKPAPAPLMVSIILMIMKQSIAWSVLIFCYVYMRQTNKTTREFWYLTFFMVFITFFLAYDFFNDFGFLIGALKWGML